MKRRLVAAGGALCLTAWLACGGGYETEATTTTDSGAPAAGERGGSCYPNSTCNQDLTCIDSLCVRLESDAGSSGAASDAGEDAEGDAMVGCPAPQKPLAEGLIQCGEETCGGKARCCPDGTGSIWKCQSEADCPRPSIVCDTNSDCPGADRCCLGVLPTPNAKQCPLRSIFTSTCAGSCPPGPFACDDDGDCPSGRRCISTQVSLGSSTTQTIVLKTCL